MSRTKTLNWELPPMSLWEACLLCNVLEEAVSVIYRAFGDELADCRAMRGDDTPRPKDAVWASSRDDTDPDDDLLF